MMLQDISTCESVQIEFQPSLGFAKKKKKKKKQKKKKTIFNYN